MSVLTLEQFREKNAELEDQIDEALREAKQRAFTLRLLDVLLERLYDKDVNPVLGENYVVELYAVSRRISAARHSSELDIAWRKLLVKILRLIALFEDLDTNTFPEGDRLAVRFPSIWGDIGPAKEDESDPMQAAVDC